MLYIPPSPVAAPGWAGPLDDHMSEGNFLRAPSPAATAAAKPAIYKVEMDDRCMVFPDGKTLAHLLVTSDEVGDLSIEAVFAFNVSRADPRLLSMRMDEAREFTRELVGAVYQAKTGFYLSDEWKIAINVMANGYQIDILKAAQKIELFLSTGVIWRFIKALLMTLDQASPVQAN